MFGFIASIFGYLLYWILQVINNYGIAIIIFTVITKLLLIPLTIKQQRSMVESQKMQPLIKDLQVRYKDDPNKLNEEYQKLMKDKKFNPFAGCLTSLIQIPIIIGMLYVVAQPLTYVMRMPQDEITAYVQEIYPEKSAEEIQTYISQNRYVQMEIIKHKNIMNLEFLGINLGDVASQNKGNYILLIIPIISALSTGISVFLTSKQQRDLTGENKKQEEESEIPMPNMKVMNAMLPVISGYVAYIVPQGLGLYWFAGSILQVAIQLIMKKTLKDENGGEVK